MKNKKILKRVLMIFLSIILVLVLTVGTYAYIEYKKIVNSVPINDLIKEFNSITPDDASQSPISGNTPPSQTTTATGTTTPATHDSTTKSSAGPSTSTHQTGVNPDKSNQNSNSPSNAKPSKNIAERLTVSEKAEAMAIVSRSFSPQDLNYLASLLHSGLTAEEKNEAVRLAYSRLSPADIAYVKTIFKKYS